MGLDMYLYAEKTVSGFRNDVDAVLSKKIRKITGLQPLIQNEDSRVSVKVEAAYWRKANAIHGWFVRKLADGVDDCEEIAVSIKKLRQLHSICWDALAYFEDGQAELSCKLLVPTGGFFFGTTELDESYKNDLEDTIRQLAPLLDSKWDDLSFSYQASW